MSRFPETWRNTGYCRTVGAGRTETIQCLFGVWPGQWEGKIYIDGKQVDIRNCSASHRPWGSRWYRRQKARRHRSGNGGW
ncbi:hypothetical protein ACLK1T_13430 [Escherichia coli]